MKQNRLFAIVMVSLFVMSCNLAVDDQTAPNVSVDTHRDAAYVPGNMIRNGGFVWGTYRWNLYCGGGSEASIYVQDGALTVDITEPSSSTTELNVNQTGLTFAKGKSYIVTFRAKADIPRPMYIKAGMIHDPWVPLYSGYEEFDLTTTYKKFAFAFTMIENTDTDSHLEFQFGTGTPTKVMIDDVVLKEISDNRISNPGFDYGLNGWESFIREGTSGEVRAFMRWSPRAWLTFYSDSNDPDPWDLELKKTNLLIEKGKTYVLSFDAWANYDRSIGVTMSLYRNPWTSYSGHRYFNLRPFNREYYNIHKYSMMFTMTEGTDPQAYLTFMCGGDFSETSHVNIDNVVLAEVE